MSDEQNPGTESGREPRQERGRRRLDAILDAAEASVAEVGANATSIGEIARRAGASVGSIYHFFPTKEAIFDAVRARLDAEAREKAAIIVAHADEWATLPLDEFVASLIRPIVAFLEKVPSHFLVPVDAAGNPIPKHEKADNPIHDAIRTAMERRYPSLTPAELALRVSVMAAIGEGMVNLMLRIERTTPRREVIRELTKALAAYLGTIERRG